ncbi:class I SAM-dependent methyltransferase [Streptosporangium sp. NBC_01810]|uniref:class I SAM-dependent methyltransferase n=1 Tax=Streptosporangium sp. NBC_01810 TaxID=2975951 RepID=UPI002DDA7A22|nr:class I SAM-dependent methyltransferase [Streptosporangium sp. NBC_01810]WSA24967.1 class I SAM-dependent methyltransferase [Streptosporangium sp. NBC_01810]
MRAIHRARASLFGLFHHDGLYDRFISRGFRSLYAKVTTDVVSATPAGGTRVLDVGTGPGRVPLAIARALPGLRVEGLDLSAEMIDRARRNAAEAGLTGRVDFTVGDVADLPYPDGDFDLIVSSMSQHHWPDVATGLRELRRVLRPGGRIWIYDFRFALRRAETAARAAFPGHHVHVETVRTSRLPIGFVGRVVVETS